MRMVFILLLSCVFIDAVAEDNGRNLYLDKLVATLFQDVVDIKQVIEISNGSNSQIDSVLMNQFYGKTVELSGYLSLTNNSVLVKNVCNTYSDLVDSSLKRTKSCSIYGDVCKGLFGFGSVCSTKNISSVEVPLSRVAAALGNAKGMQAR